MAQKPAQPENAFQEVPRAPDDVIETTDSFVAEEVEKPTKAKAAASEDEDSSNPSDSAPDTKKQNRSNYQERKLRRLERKYAEATNEVTSTKAELAEMREELAELKAAIKTTSKATPEPKLEDFKTPQEYAKAFAKWEADQSAEPPPRKKPETKKPPAKTPPKTEDMPEDIRAFHERGKGKFGDEFMEALGESVAVNQAMAEYMMDHDLGPDIYIHLANNPEESIKIYNSSERRAMKMLDALAEKATKGELDIPEDGEFQYEEEGNDHQDDDEEEQQQPAGKAPAKGRTETKAKKPPGTTREKGTVKPNKDLETMDMDDYVAMRRKQEADAARF
jgi:hypothetical protein